MSKKELRHLPVHLKSSPAISSTNATMRRRTLGSFIRMNALVSASPSLVARNSDTYAGDGVAPFSSDWPGRCGAPSKKNGTGTCRIWEICCKRLAPMRFVPFSYFCTCWNVRPSASPSFSWLIDNIMRRIRTRLPTCLSMGLGAFLAITPSYAAAGLRNVHFWREKAIRTVPDSGHQREEFVQCKFNPRLHLFVQSRQSRLY